MFGKRTAKVGNRIEAIGSLDELNAARRQGVDDSAADYPHWTPRIFVHNAQRWESGPQVWFSRGVRLGAKDAPESTLCTAVHMRVRGIALLERGGRELDVRWLPLPDDPDLAAVAKPFSL